MGEESTLEVSRQDLVRMPADYPMVAPTYAKLRSEFAKKIGLGRKDA